MAKLANSFTDSGYEQGKVDGFDRKSLGTGGNTARVFGDGAGNALFVAAVCGDGYTAVQQRFGLAGNCIVFFVLQLFVCTTAIDSFVVGMEGEKGGGAEGVGTQGGALDEAILGEFAADHEYMVIAGVEIGLAVQVQHFIFTAEDAKLKV